MKKHEYKKIGENKYESTNSQIRLILLINEYEYRTLKKNSWGGWNRTIYKGRWNGHHFTGYTGHQSGDPFPSVVAWRPLKEEDLGEKYYPKCLGVFLDF